MAQAILLLQDAIPLLDDWEATRGPQAGPATAGIPIIALTAHALEPDRKRAEEVDAMAISQRPVEPDHVVEEVERFFVLPALSKRRPPRTRPERSADPSPMC